MFYPFMTALKAWVTCLPCAPRQDRLEGAVPRVALGGMYESILEAGARGGDFELAAPARPIARGLVALEDGLGLQVVIAHPGIDSAEAERILLEHASMATRYELAGLPLAREHGRGGLPGLARD
jgi:hypothetical protein